MKKLLFTLVVTALCIGPAAAHAYPLLPTPVSFPSVIDGPIGMVNANFNGDDYEDIAVVSFDVPAIAIYAGSASGLAFSTSTSSAGRQFIDSGDFNNDNIPDIVVIDRLGNDISFFVSDGSLGFSTSSNLVLGGTFKRGLVAADLNNDNFDDVVTLDLTSNLVYILLNDQDGTYTISTIASGVSANEGSIEVGQFNNDGFFDIVIGDLTVGSETIIMLGNGDGTFGAPTTYNLGAEIPGLVTVGDYNQDGFDDFAMTNQGTASLFVSLSNGDGTFPVGTSYALPAGGYDIDTTDVNDDGYPDIVIPHLSLLANSTTVLLNDGDGTFTVDETLTGTASLTAAAAAGDFNNDGRQDLAIVGQSNDTVNVHYGTTTDIYISDNSAEVVEGGAGVDTSLRLSYEPDSQVDLVPSAREGEATADGVCFVPTGGIGGSFGPYAPCVEWDTWATTTVMAIDDSNIEGRNNDNITFTASSSDSLYQGQTQYVSVTVIDNEGGEPSRSRGGGSSGGSSGSDNDDEDTDEEEEPEENEDDEPVDVDELTEELEDLIEQITELGGEAVTSGTPASPRAALNELQSLTERNTSRAKELQDFLAGEVLGDATARSCNEYNEYHREGDAGGDITKIQQLLHTLEFLGEGYVAGTIDAPTFAAIKAFQAHASEKILTPWGIATPTGYWYKTTRKYANWLIGCVEPQVFLEKNGGGTYFDY